MGLTPAFGKDLVEAVRAGKEGKQREAETGVAGERKKLVKEEQLLRAEQAGAARASAAESQARRDLLLKQTETEGYNADHRRLELPAAMNRSAVESGSAGETFRWIERLREAIGISPGRGRGIVPRRNRGGR